MNTQPSHRLDPDSDAEVEYLRQSLEGAHKVIREYRTKIKTLQKRNPEAMGEGVHATPILSGDARYREAEATIADLRIRLSSSEARLNENTNDLSLKEEELTRAKMRCLELETRLGSSFKTMTSVVHAAEPSFDKSKAGKGLTVQCEKAQRGLEEVALKGRGFLEQNHSIIQSELKSPSSASESKQWYHPSRNSERHAKQRNDISTSAVISANKPVTDFKAGTHASSSRGPQWTSWAATFGSQTATRPTAQRAPMKQSARGPFSSPYVPDTARPAASLYKSTGDGTAASKKVELAPPKGHTNLMSVPTRSRLTPGPARLTADELRKSVFEQGAADHLPPVVIPGWSDFEPKLSARELRMQKIAEGNESDASDDSEDLDGSPSGKNLPKGEGKPTPTAETAKEYHDYEDPISPLKEDEKVQKIRAAASGTVFGDSGPAEFPMGELESRRDGRDSPPVGKKRKSTDLIDNGDRKRVRSESDGKGSIQHYAEAPKAIMAATEKAAATSSADDDSLSEDDEKGDVAAKAPLTTSVFSGPLWDAYIERTRDGKDGELRRTRGRG